MHRLLYALILACHCQLSLAETNGAQLAVGDWVFRHGTSIESRLIASFGSGDFSHIGIVVATSPQIQILHATTNDSATHPNQVILSDWDEFTSPGLAHNFAVARPLFLGPQQQEQIRQALLAQLGQPFVLAARELPHLYCTTLLADAISAVAPDIVLEWSYLQQPLVRGYYLHPDAFASQQLRWIIPLRQTALVSASHHMPRPAAE